jgi:hypothetical protein
MFHAAANQRNVRAGFSEGARHASGDTSATARHERDVVFQDSVSKDFVSHSS